MNSPGFEIGNEVALVRRHGTYMVVQSCIMGQKKGLGLYEIRSYDGKEQLATRAELQTFNDPIQQAWTLPTGCGIRQAGQLTR